MYKIYLIRPWFNSAVVAASSFGSLRSYGQYVEQNEGRNNKPIEHNET